MSHLFTSTTADVGVAANHPRWHESRSGDMPVNQRDVAVVSGQRQIPAHRWIGVAFRTAHLISAGVLLGGHVFDVDPARQLPFLYGAIATGVAMIALECAAAAAWLGMTKGVCALGKVALLGAVPWCWDQRVVLLVAVTVIAGVSSHMPARFRHYPLVARIVTPVITAARPTREHAR